MTVHRADHSVTRPDYLGGGTWELTGMTDVTVLMGRNGSGKSVLLRSWRDQDKDAVHYVVPERTGDIQFQPAYIQEEFTGATRSHVSQRNFVPEYRRRIVSRLHTYLMKRGNVRGQMPNCNPELLETLLGILLPDFEVEILAETPPYSLRHPLQSEKVVSVDQLSSGEAQLFTMGLDILTIAAIWEIEGRKERVMLIDEPDAHIHPDMQVRLAEFFLNLTETFNLQLVVATHSTSLLAALGQVGGMKTSVAYVRRSEREYRLRPFNKVQKSLATLLGGHALMGPLFGVPLLLVEGDDDYQIWSQVPRHNVVHLSAVPCNGQEIFDYQRELERILNSLCEPPSNPIAFALLDHDKSLSVPTAANPQRHVGFIRLACHEAENLYLTAEVLSSLGHTWTTAIEALSRASGQRGSKQEALASCASWNRREQDLKAVIKEVAAILDPKNVAWTTRVGAALGKAVPTGELADFLGSDVVDALWQGKVTSSEISA